MWILFEQDRTIGVFDSEDEAWKYWFEFNEEARRKAEPKLLVPHIKKYALNPKVG